MNTEQDHSGQRFELHLPVTSNDELVPALLAESGKLGIQQAKRCMHNGAVWLERGQQIQRVRRAKKSLQPGDIIHLYYDTAIQQMTCAQAELVDDRGEYSVWNKPYGMYSQGSRWGDHCTLYRQAETHLQPQRPAFTVHRLDRAACGLMILAHSRKTAKAFGQMFEQRQINKHYRLECEGKIKPELLPLHIDEAIDGKTARTEIREIEASSGTTSRVIVSIETGRKHQIRKHLAGIGHPLLGDRLYGHAGPGDTNLRLQSCMLAFDCPLEHSRRQYRLAEFPPD